MQMFDLIDKSTELLELRDPTFQYVEKKVIEVMSSLLESSNIESLGFSSRIKSVSSLKEKMIRNKYYLTCKTPEEVLETLPDLIGITVECRFINEENTIYQQISKHFNINVQGYSRCNQDENLYMNLAMPQPQTQRNGYTCYRVDGYYMFSDQKVNFELQIKSMVHRFWSEIEHQVVYKNTHFLFNDSFMTSILSSIYDNLEVVDHQLQIVYNQIESEGNEINDFGMTERGFKVFLAKSLSDLYSKKMVDSVGFTTDFKRSSGILSQYIYVKDFLRNEAPQQQMLDYFERFNLLKLDDFDFTKQISLERRFEHPDIFCDKLGKYWQDIINVDFEWHAFFIMMFLIQARDPIDELGEFVEFIKDLILPKSWFESLFNRFDENVSKSCKEKISIEIADALISNGKIDTIYEESLFKVTHKVQNLINEFDKINKTDVQFNKNINGFIDSLKSEVIKILER